MRQEEAAAGVGLVDWSFEKSGREERGTGGGLFLEGLGLGSRPFVNEGSSGLFMPSVRAERAGIGGGCSFLAADVASGLEGRLGGSDGVVGTGCTSTVATDEVDFVPFNGFLAFSASR